MASLILQEIIVILGLSLGVLVLCHKLAVPSIVGLLVTGVIAGPHGLGLVRAEHEIEVLAEIGVILLLFTVGIEFSLSRLFRIKDLIAFGGILQTGCTTAVFFALALALGLSPVEGSLIAFLGSLSSTALVLKLLQRRAEIDSLYGRETFAILLFQDLVVVPVMLLLPLLSEATISSQVAASFARSLLLFSFGILALFTIVPKFLDLIARTHDHDIFLISIVVICLAIPFLTESAGLSLALGALIAGLLISRSEYTFQTLSNVLPFQQLFTSIFFVSIGMLLDVAFLFDHALSIIGLTVVVVILKALLAIPAALLLGLPLRVGILSGLALAQVGEFSFILGTSAEKLGLLTSQTYQMFLSVSILTIALTPYLFRYSRVIAIAFDLIPLPRVLRYGYKNVPLDDLHAHPELTDHLILIGFGTNGSLVAEAAEQAGIPFVGLDIDPDIVKRERALGRQVVYGDGTREAVLQEEGISRAKVVSVGLPDPISTRRVVGLTRALNPSAYIVVRSQIPHEVEELTALGANRVVLEKVEAGAEMASCILDKYLVPRRKSEGFVTGAKEDHYEAFRHPHSLALDISDMSLEDLELHCYQVAEGSGHIGKTLHEFDLEREGTVTPVALRRGSSVLSNPPGHTILRCHDVVIMLGLSERGGKSSHLKRSQRGEGSTLQER